MSERWQDFVARLEPTTHARLATALGEGLQAARRAAEAAAENDAVTEARAALDAALSALAAARALLDDPARRVWVRRRAERPARAAFPLPALDRVHLAWLSGGVGPRLVLHAFVSCTDLLDGDLDHACVAGSEPHRFRVAVLVEDNPPETVVALARRAGFTTA